MTAAWFDQPAPPTGARRPWDEVLEEFAAKHGRPCWPVTRTNPSSIQRKVITNNLRLIREMAAAGSTAEAIQRQLRDDGVSASLDAIHKAARGATHKRPTPPATSGRQRFDNVTLPKDTLTRAEVLQARGWAS